MSGGTLPLFGGVSRQPLDLDGVADARLCCRDMSLIDFASSGVETIRPRDGFGNIGGHPLFAAGNYERAAVGQVRRGILSASKLIESLDMAQKPLESGATPWRRVRHAVDRA